MHLAGIGSTFGHLIFKAVQLAEDIHRDANVMLLKAVDARGVVQEDVGVENEGLGADNGIGNTGGTLSAGGGEGGCEPELAWRDSMRVELTTLEWSSRSMMDWRVVVSSVFDGGLGR
jgi:hypothetical protein